MKTCIANVRIIDGRGGCVEGGSVLFSEDGILEVSGGAVGGADKTISGEGCTLLPGLIESHAHLGMDCSLTPFATIEKDNEASAAIRSYADGMKFLEYGVTTIRNMGTRFDADITYRNMVNAGLVAGPRVLACGMLITMTGGHGHVIAHECDSPNEVKKAARLQIKKGADVIKLIATGGVLTQGSEIGAPQLSEEEMRAACREADLVGKTTAAHSIGISGIKNAIRAGITTLEHGYFVDDEAIELMQKHNTYFVPTITAPISMIKHGADSDIPFVQVSIAKALPLIENHKTVFKKAMAAGLKIVAGTDQGTPYNFPGLIVNELEKFVEYGMAPMAAITAATYTAAECMRLDKLIGSIEKGKLADLVLVRGNPLDHIRNVTNVLQVYQGGTISVDKLQ